jgi:hypothetical protein
MNRDQCNYLQGNTTPPLGLRVKLYDIIERDDLKAEISSRSQRISLSFIEWGLVVGYRFD